MLDSTGALTHGWASMRSFRIGATSFVYPAGWLANVERLVGRVDDVELLFFDPRGSEGLPSAAEWAGLARLRAVSGISYSVHTPLTASLASEDEARRRAGVASVLHVIEQSRAADPSHIVVHVYLGDREQDERPADLDAFRERGARSLVELIAAGVSPAALCVEYLDYDLDLFAPVLEQLGVQVALDIGHLARDGRDLRAIVQRYLPRTRLIQWHGTAPDGRDHRGLEHFPEADARWLVETLLREQYRGVLTLEVFREADFERSLGLLHGWLKEHDA
jgi:sugar phosphate isomerase/epimerase